MMKMTMRKRKRCGEPCATERNQNNKESSSNSSSIGSISSISAFFHVPFSARQRVRLECIVLVCVSFIGRTYIFKMRHFLRDSVTDISATNPEPQRSLGVGTSIHLWYNPTASSTPTGECFFCCLQILERISHHSMISREVLV